VNSRTFGLLATRKALGNLGPINRTDPMTERDLLWDAYRNFGNETRFCTPTKPSAIRLPSWWVRVTTRASWTGGRAWPVADTVPISTYLNPDSLENF
jgi:Fe(3+) dicitrate transport protein